MAALATAYHYLSHAYHIGGRFLDGFDPGDGRGLHRPDFEVASLFIDRRPRRPRPREWAAGTGSASSPTIADALTLGTAGWLSTRSS